jgi:hypothetical protein
VVDEPVTAGSVLFPDTEISWKKVADQGELGLSGGKRVCKPLGLRGKHQITSTKTQINSNEQNSKSVEETLVDSKRGLFIWNWGLGFIWNLIF